MASGLPLGLATGTLLTAAEHLMAVGLDDEAVGVGNLVLETLDLRTHELQDRAAFDANHMIMVSMTKLVLEADQAVLELDRLRELGIHEHLEGTVDRGAPDTGMLSMDHAVEIVRGHVPAGVEEVPEDALALLRVFEAVSREVVVEDVELLATLFLGGHDPNPEA